MTASVNAGSKDSAATNNEQISVFKHDIKNQLSNILLAVEQLRSEISDPSEDYIFYLDCIASGSAKIDTLLKEAEQGLLKTADQ